MNFNKHLELRGKHALFSPSQPSWIRYEKSKILDRLGSQYANTVGSLIHEFAASQIILRHRVTSKKALQNEVENFIYQKYFDDRYQEMRKDGKPILSFAGEVVSNVFDTIKDYINDGIGYKMIVEQPLVFNEDFFGTADTIVFRDGMLRIHDLKTGVLPAKMEQLQIYAALFFLEYAIKPGEVDMELRLYQSNEIIVFNPTVEDILPIMDTILKFSKLITETKVREGWE